MTHSMADYREIRQNLTGSDIASVASGASTLSSASNVSASTQISYVAMDDAKKAMRKKAQRGDELHTVQGYRM